MTRTYSLLNDPIYYAAVVLFALAATLLPAFTGGAWFLPLAQTAALWLLALVAFRRGSGRAAWIVLAIWVAVQAAAFFAFALILPARADTVVGGGFDYREALLLWRYTDAPLPASLATAPLLRLLEVAGVTLGALLTGGIVGVWFLVRTVNLQAFGAAALVAGSESAASGLLWGLLPWGWLRIAGSIGLIATLALVGYTGQWSPWGWPRGRRRLLWVSLGLIAAGLFLEWIVA